MKTNAMLQKTPVIGVCWYLLDQWAAVKASATDAESFEDTFSEWEAMAATSFTLVRRAFPKAMKVYIHAEEFLAWCHARTRTNNSNARVEFVSEKVQTLVPQPPKSTVDRKARQKRPRS